MRIKVVPVGDRCRGSSTYSAKTSLLQSFTTLASDKGDKPFYRVAPEYLPTVFENFEMQYKDDGGNEVILSLWDTAGMVSIAPTRRQRLAAEAAGSRLRPPTPASLHCGRTVSACIRLQHALHLLMLFCSAPSRPSHSHRFLAPAAGGFRADPHLVLPQHQRLSPRL